MFDWFLNTLLLNGLSAYHSVIEQLIVFNVRETVRHFPLSNEDGIYVVKVIVLKSVTQGSRSSAVSLEVRDFIHSFYIKALIFQFQNDFCLSACSTSSVGKGY